MVELVGAAHAPQAVVLAFDELGNEIERWAVCLEDLTFPSAYYLNDEDDDAPISYQGQGLWREGVGRIAKALLDSKILPKLFARRRPTRR